MTIAIIALAVALLLGLTVVAGRRRASATPPDRDVPHIRPTEGGAHQGRSPGADGGGTSYGVGGGGG